MPPRRKGPSRPADAPERWLIYCRQSDTDDAGRDSLSLDSQASALRAAAADRGAVVVDVVRDADLRGYLDEEQRPALREALERADAGEYDVLAVWELSRLARKLSLQERVLERMEIAGVRLYSHREPWASATMIRQILGAVAEETTRTIGAHVSRAMRERRRQGRWTGAPPYGYRVGPEGHLVVDAEAADVVRACYARYVAGASMVDVARHLNATGVPTPNEHQGSRAQRARPNLGGWSVNTVTRMLRNPVYTGLLVAGGDVVPAAHEPIVDEVTWQRAQRRREETARALPGSRFGRSNTVDTFLDGGRARCSCGARLQATWTAQYRPDRSMRVYHVLRCGALASDRRQGRARAGCDARPRTVMLHIAETFVRRRLATDLASVRPWPSVLEELEAAVCAAAPDRDVQRTRLTRRRHDVAGQRDRAVSLHVTGRIDLDAYDHLVAGIGEELAAIDAELATLVPDPPREGLERMALAAREWAPLITDAPADAMRAAMAATGARLVLDGAVAGRLRLEYTADFAALLPLP